MTRLSVSRLSDAGGRINNSQVFLGLVGMHEVLWTVILCTLLIVGAVGGFVLRSLVPEPHRNQPTIEFLRIVTALLVTFAALVMSLILASVRNSYDSAFRDRSHYAASLVQLDACMRNYGPELADARVKLHRYTAAVIASTWPDEPPPQGVDYPDAAGMPRLGEVPVLATIMNDIGIAIGELAPGDTLHRSLAARCTADYREVASARWVVIEDVHGSLSAPFAIVLIFWLTLVFLSFGLQAPRNLLASVAIGIAIISVTSAMFVILDLDIPYGGLFGIPSTSMRLALTDMLR
jgi:hypothetical protein